MGKDVYWWTKGTYGHSKQLGPKHFQMHKWNSNERDLVNVENPKVWKKKWKT
jgi:hypothetical protein